MPQDKKSKFGSFGTTPTPTPNPTGSRFGTIGDKEESLLPSFITEPVSSLANTETGQAVISTISPVLNFLSRPGYASAKFADSLLDESKSILDSVLDGFSELSADTFLNPGTKQQRISYSDVIKRRFPEFAVANPKATTILGFVGDVALDPTSYLGTGLIKNGIRVGGKVLTREVGEEFAKELVTASRKAFVGKNNTIEIIEQLAKEGSRSTPRATRIAPLSNELAQQGYFQAIRNKQIEIDDFLNNLSGVSDPQLAMNLAKSETLADLKRFGKNRIPDELFVDEVRERLEKRIVALTELNPDLRDKFFEKKSLYLTVGLPFAKQKELVRLVGLEGITNKVNALTSYIESSSDIGAGLVKAGRTLNATFNRDYGLPEEYINLRNDLENYKGYVVGQTIRDTIKLFNTDKQGRERIGQAMTWIDDQSRNLEQLRLGNVANDEYEDLFQRGLNKFKLTDDEKAIATTLQQDYKQAALLEMRADLLKTNLVNYSPRGYEVIADPNDMTMVARGQFKKEGAPSAYLVSAQERKFRTSEEAKAAGFDLEMDAAILYSHRIIQSKIALANKQFRDSIEEMYGTPLQKTTIAKSGILPTTITNQAIPQRVIDDMRLLGDAFYPSGMSDTQKTLLKGFDQLQRFFKVGATTIRPGFAAKQLVSNTFQAALVSGVRAFKALDPRVAMDAALMLGFRDKYSSTVPTFIQNFLTKSFPGNNGLDAALAQRIIAAKIVGEDALTDFAKDFNLVDVFGVKRNGTELVQLARENGIIRDIDSTGEQFSRKISQELNKTNSIPEVGFELAKVWKHAAMVEDYARMNLFLNGIRMGKSARESAGLVNKALFDYQRGLSGLERNVIRRIVPFYSFQRFAIPYLFKETIKKPGNYITVDKLVKTVDKLLSTGEELTPAEQSVFGESYLIEQPRVFSGFDKDGKAVLNILNNLTPFDALNLFVYDKDGKMDYQRTAEKSFLGALTPFLKVPLEGVLDKNFFTNKTIQQAATLGDLSSIGATIPKPVKDLMGWEDRTDLVTGKTKTYLSPFLSYYSMQFFPVLRDYIKGNEEVDFSGTNPLTRGLFAAMNMVVQSSRVFSREKLDLKEQYEYSLLQVNKRFNDLNYKIMESIVKGSKSDEVLYQEKLNDLLKVFEEKEKIRSASQIRGQGIGQPVANLEGSESAVNPPSPTIQQPFK